MTQRPREPADHPGREPKARRLSAALRENLKRRKAQARERQESRRQGRDQGRERPAADGTQEIPHDSAGFGKDKCKDK